MSLKRTVISPYICAVVTEFVKITNVRISLSDGGTRKPALLRASEVEHRSASVYIIVNSGFISQCFKPLIPPASRVTARQQPVGQHVVLRVEVVGEIGRFCLIF